MTEAVIVSTARTPIGKAYRGALNATEGATLLGHALGEAVARAKTPGLDRNARLALLLHDAPEYVVGDMISPFKAVIGDSYKAVENRLLAAIHEGLRPAGLIAMVMGKQNPVDFVRRRLGHDVDDPSVAAVD